MSIAGLLCAGLADFASAQPQAAQASYLFCYSTQANWYYSGIFVIDPSVDADYRAWNAAIETELRAGGRAPNPGPAPWVKEFNRFIAATYANSRKDGGACEGGRTSEEAQKRLDEIIQYQQRLNAQLQRQSRYQLVETGWRYTPSPSATSAAPPSSPAVAAPMAAAAKPQAPYVVCHDTGDTYFSAVFDGNKGDRRAWTLGFIQFLKEKYGYTARTSACDALRSLPEAQRFLKARIDTARSFKREVIETGWVY